MTNRERLQSILNHKEADRVPLDIGAGKCCKMHVRIYKKLLDHFGIKDTVRICARMSQAALTCDEFLEKLECDVRAPYPVFQKSAKPAEEWEEADGSYLRDDWGTVMRMPKEGLYYDMVKAPLAGTLDDTDLNYTFPSLPFVLPEAVIQAKAYQEAGYPVCLPEQYGNGFLQTGPKVFGYEDWMMMLALKDKRIYVFMEELLERKMQFYDHVTEAFGDSIDVIMETEDLGTQTGPYIDPEMFRQLLKPYHKKLYDHIRKRTGAKIFLHSCGAIAKLIPDLIDIGLDILNPVQIGATGMDPVFLKREYGKHLTFWGGGIDTQKMLPYGTPAEIRDHVRRNIEIFSKDGGFVFSAVHNIQADVPLENVLAMWEAFKEFRVY